MTTKAEEFLHDQERQHPSKKDRQRSSKRKSGSRYSNEEHTNKRAAKKAVYALEDTVEDAKPSRKSTRKSANRARSDQGELTRANLKQGSPQAQHDKASANSK